MMELVVGNSHGSVETGLGLSWPQWRVRFPAPAGCPADFPSRRGKAFDPRSRTGATVARESILIPMIRARMGTGN
jgi:hypothetical protein